VIKHELLINGTLDINFQQGSMGLGMSGTGGVPTSECTGTIEQLTETTHQVAAGNVTGVTSNAASAAAVYASTNAATPAASPSWVH
jgi:forkhead box protein O3